MKTDLYGSVLDNKGNIFEKLGLKLDSLCYVGVEEDVMWRQEEGGDVVVLVVTFKVNDPITDITLNKA